MLHATHVPGDDPPVVFLHGFMGCGADWHGFAAQTHEITGRATICIDLPGHGSTPLSGLREWDAVAAAVVETAQHIGGSPTFDLVGYSMGGRLALVTTRLHPAAVRSTLVIGSHPGLASPGERAARRFQDRELAASLNDDPLAFLDRWESNSLFGAADSAAWNLARQRRRDTAPAACFGWSEALRSFSLGGQPSCWEPTDSEPPSFFIAGHHDTRYRAIGARFASSSPRRTFTDAPKAAHAVHLDRPDVVMRILGTMHRSLR